MSFDQPLLLLLLLLLPALWYGMRRVPGSSHVCLALKCAAFAVLVIALAGPGVILKVNKLAVTVLMDVSASMPRESLQRGQTMLRDLVRKKSGADLRLITFDANARLRPVAPQAADVVIPQGVDATEGMSTDLESALQLAVNTFPADGARRVLLISDGNENSGHALSAALRAREHGATVFAVPSGGMAPLPISAESVASPQTVLSGEHFTVSARLNSGHTMAVRVWITASGREVGSTTLNLQAGVNPINVDARIVDSGVTLLEGHISSNGSEQVFFSQAVTVRRPRVLEIAGGDGPSQPLLDSLKIAQVDVKQAPAFPMDAADQNYDAVLLDNYPDHELPEEEEAALEKYVSDGGGLIYIAGDKNAKLAREPKTPLQKLLPVRALSPKEKPTAVVLVLDKSGSMKGPPIRIVREAAHASLIALRPIDRVGVISFDQGFDWVIPMMSAADIQSKADLIDKIEADGNTNIYQPLLSAYNAILPERVSSRHIILLTDGDQTPFTFQNFAQLEQNAARDHVEISTIGLGVDVNHVLLDELAQKTKGKAHYVLDPKLVPEIVNDEVRSTDDLAIQERTVHAIRVRSVDLTDGIDFQSAPPLLGFVQSDPKENTETILGVDRDKPLLVRWHYGLGSVMAFMSDARSRWAAPWVSWKSYGTLWPQMVRSVARQEQPVRATVRIGPRTNDQQSVAIVQYEVVGEAGSQADLALSRSDATPLTVEAPDGTGSPLPLVETGPGRYEGRVLADQRGLYRIVGSDASLALPEVGFYRDSDELKPQPVSMALLSEISHVTGGVVNPSIEQLLDDRGSVVRQRIPMWPYLIVLALALNFAELALRRGFLKWPVARSR